MTRGAWKLLRQQLPLLLLLLLLGGRRLALQGRLGGRSGGPSCCWGSRLWWTKGTGTRTRTDTALGVPELWGAGG